MFADQLLLSLGAVVAVTATNIITADYGGLVTTFSLTDHNGTYNLAKVAESGACAPNPSWLTLDLDRGLLFCINEGLDSVNGSLSSYTINFDGSLEHVQNLTVINGPVNGVIYGYPTGPRGLALAHYGGSSVSSYLIDDDGKITFNNAFTYDIPTGPKPQQDASHPHEVVLDPTGQYIVVPDLGADLLHVLTWDPDTLKLEELDPLHFPPGTGPRHTAFWNPYSTVCEGCTTFLYVVAELAATVTGLAVEYLPNRAGLSFSQVYNSTTFGPLEQPAGTAPAEVHVSEFFPLFLLIIYISVPPKQTNPRPCILITDDNPQPDNRFLLISNRNDTSFTIPLPNGTTIASDSLSSFALQSNGSLCFDQLWPAGGSFPRHFSTNAVGDLVGVGEQYTQDVVLLRRDVGSGRFVEDGEVARVPLGGQVTNVLFVERKALGVLGG